MKIKKIILAIIITLISVMSSGCEKLDIEKILGLDKNKVTYKICFYVDDVMYSKYYMDGVGEITMPLTPSKEDSSFDGWYFDKDTWSQRLNESTYAVTPLDKDIDVYAKFTYNNVIGSMCDILISNSFEVDGTTYQFNINYGRKTLILNQILSESVESLNLEGVFSLTQNTTFTIYRTRDFTNSMNVVQKSSVEVANGINTYYVLVKNISYNQSKTYTMTFEK